MNKKTAQTRLGRLRRQLRGQALDALIVTNPANVTYLTGFLGEDSWLLVGPRTVLVTDSRYIEQAHDECVGGQIHQRTEPMIPAVAGLLNRWKQVATVGIEDTCTMAQFRAIRKALKKNKTLKAVGSPVGPLRQIKDADEADQVRRAARAGWTALARALAHLRPGLTEGELAGELESQMRRMGLRPAFDTIVCFGPNGSRNHHQPGSRKLRKADTILIDFGVRRNGYCSDTTRTFAFGKAGEEFTRAYEAVRAAQQAAIEQIRPGAALKTIDAAAREAIARRGFEPHGHGTGHGLGLAVHEEPYLAKTAKGRLQTGQLLTVEPGIYIPGRFGIRIEDDVLVTESGHTILTRDKQFGFSRPELSIL